MSDNSVPLSGQTDSSSNLDWVDASDGYVPRGAVVGGYDRSGETLYLARAEYRGALTPGKLASSHRGASVSWGGEEHRVSRYQVLVGNIRPYNWEKTCGSNIPREAFRGGVTENGETLYIGRVQHDCSLTPGKVSRSEAACYIPFDGKELKFSQYEILTY